MIYCVNCGKPNAIYLGTRIMFGKEHDLYQCHQCLQLFLVVKENK